jgi:hypothetical protein
MYITVGVLVDSAMSLSWTSLFGMSVTADAIVSNCCDNFVLVDKICGYEELEIIRHHLRL